MNRRDIKAKAVLFSLILAISIFGSVFSVFVPRALALGNVTLSASFHDDDAEDTHQATQWVVLEGATTIYDSGADAVNKETIVVNASYFTAGNTYSWKARMQDQHSQWGDYSALASFTYGSAPTPTPTPTATSTVTATATATATATSTATTTATSTVTATATTTSTATSTISPTGDIYVMGAQMIVPNGGEVYALGSTINVEYYADPAQVSGFIFNSCLERPTNWYHDLYISTDGGQNYERIVANVDYTVNCQFVGSQKGSRYIRVKTSWSIPEDQRLIGSNAKMAIVVYQKDILNDFGLGSKFSPGLTWNGDQYHYLASDPSDNVFSIVSDQITINVDQPNSGTTWTVGDNGAIAWRTTYSNEFSQKVEKVNMYLSPDGGATFPFRLAQNISNIGESVADVLKKYISSDAVVKIEGLDGSGRVITVGKSESFRIVPAGVGGGEIDEQCQGCVCVGPYCSKGDDVSNVLVLGTLAALAIPYALAVLSSLPLGMRLFGFLGPASQQILGGLLSKSAFLSSIGEATGSPMFFPPTKKGQESWGVIYDSLSKKPIAGAVVKIYTQSSGRLKDIKYANKNGEFAMLVPSGTYRIISTKAGYKFPSSIVISKKDGKYIGIYRGGYFDVKKTNSLNKAPVNISIPMDAVGFSMYEAIYASSISFGIRFWNIVRYPLMAFGLILSLYLAVQYNSMLQYAVVALYIIMIVFDLKTLFRQKNYGRILDQKGRALDRVIVRALNKGGKIKGTAVTSDDGRFAFNLNPGQYAFVASRNGFATSKIEYIDISKMTDLGRVVLRMIKINKK